MSIVLDKPFANPRSEPAFHISFEVASDRAPAVEAIERRSDFVRCVVRERMVSQHREYEHWNRLAAGVTAARNGAVTDLTDLSDADLIASLCR